MPHKDRAARLAYMAAYHERTRETARPIAQENPELPPFGVLVADAGGEKIQCHVCGRWLGSLPLHINRAHGISADTYKEEFGLARLLPLWSPRTIARQSAAATARDQSHAGVPISATNRVRHEKGTPDRLGSRIRRNQAH